MNKIKNKYLINKIKENKEIKRVALLDFLSDFLIALLILGFMFLPLFKTSYVLGEKDVNTLVAPNVYFSFFDEFIKAKVEPISGYENLFNVRYMPLLAIFIALVSCIGLFIILGSVKLFEYLTSRRNVLSYQMVYEKNNKLSTRLLIYATLFFFVFIVLLITTILVKDIYVRECMTNKESDFALAFSDDYLVKFPKLTALTYIYLVLLFIPFIFIYCVEYKEKEIINSIDIKAIENEYKELEEIILKHQKIYPCMLIDDYIKIVLQNEFGPGHIITNKEMAKERILAEVATINPNNREYEDIGNGYVRVYLNSLAYHHLDESKLLDLLIASSAPTGSLSNYKSKLNYLLMMAKDNKLNIGYKEFKTYLHNYSKKGYQIISHSSKYKDEYHPSYRVIKKELLEKNDQ